MGGLERRTAKRRFTVRLSNGYLAAVTTASAPCLRFAVYASGRGSNFEALLLAWRRGEFEGPRGLLPALLIVNKATAGALELAQHYGIPSACIENHDPEPGRTQMEILQDHGIDRIALAGFLRPIPPEVVQAYPEQILNIHPGPLPRFGGHKMYGRFVHQAALDAGVEHSGPTVHRVDEVYDRGPIIAHQPVPVLGDDDASSLAQRVLKVEHELFARALRWDWGQDPEALLPHQRAGLSSS